MLPLRVFLASPGDVPEERKLALELLQQLPDEPFLDGKVTIKVVARDKPGGGVAMEATLTPQEAIKRGLPKPSECDLVIVILWSRLGTPLPEDWEKKPDGSRYLSGTEWEYLDAVAGSKRPGGKPKIWLYRRTEKVLLDPDDADFDERSRQKRLVNDFFAALRESDGSIRGGCNDYTTPGEFKEMLRTHLHAWLKPLVDGPDVPPLGNAPEPQQPSVAIDVAALRDAYLNRLMVRCGHVSLSGIDPQAASQRHGESQLSLNAIYTALLTRTPKPCELAALPPKRPEQEVEREEKLRSALEQLDQHPHLVLQGEAGSGKSTFANFVALCLAGALRGDPKVNLAALTAPLPDDEGHLGTEPQPWHHPELLPVLVVLRDLAATGLPPVGQPATVQHLWSFIERDLEEGGHGDYAPHLRKTLFEQGGLLLLDGLDEVPEAEHRREQIRQLVENFVAGFPKCRVLVTSRIYAYQNQGWRLNGFAEAVLAPFSDGQIRRFVDGWYAHLAQLERLKSGDAAGRAELLKRAIFSRPTLYELAQRPLLLTLMASLHAWRGGELPEGREQLYADAVDLLLNVWEQRRVRRAADGSLFLDEPSLAEYLRTDRSKVREVLQRLAFEAHRAQPEATGTADLAEDALAGALLRLSTAPDANPKRLIAYLRDRAGLLHPRGVGVYTFPHRSFQEYLTACHLTAADDYPDGLAELARTDPNRWREVALLAGAKAARGTAASLWLLVDALCCVEPDPAAIDPADDWGAQIAAQALVETADLSRVSKANRTKLDRLRRWLQHLMTDPAMPLTERALAGDNLGLLGDPRPGVGVRPDGVPDIDWAAIPGGTVTLEDGAGTAEVPPFEMARYPVTNAQFEAFIDAADGYPNADWRTDMPEDAADGPQAPRWSEPNRPRETVSWYEAVAFCRWLSRRLGYLVRLPNEFEWQQAATGGDSSNTYPWGPDWDAARCNSAESGLNHTTAAGLYPDGATAQGVLDLSGNVFEWCLNKYDEPADTAIDATGDWRTVRGGSWGGLPDICRAASRRYSPPYARYVFVGFRVVRPPSPDR